MNASPNDEETRADSQNDSPQTADTETVTATESRAASEAGSATETTAAESETHKMSLDVSIEDAGPCKKHVRVRVPKDDIQHYYLEAVGEMSDSATVPGFRVGHVPTKLIQRRFRKELYNQVKQQVLVDSLEQMAEEHELDPINEPDFDVESIEIRGDQDFEYEFDVEVRPEFELPDYEGLTIKRPVREITQADVDAYLEKFLAQYGELIPREGAAEKDDFITTALDITRDGRPLRSFPELTIQLKPVLRFQDAELDGFDDLMAGVCAGETREAEMTVSPEAEAIEMRSETVQATFRVKEVMRQELPDLSKPFLQRIGVESIEELRKDVEGILERQVTYEQRQSARAQVMEQITGAADWELPEQLVLRQVENAVRREILEMQQAGFTKREIRARENLVRQQAVSTTRQALKEHFVLDKISTMEGVEVTPSDIEAEIMLMAIQRGENPRRVRARLTKSGMIENLEAQIFERKAVDIILDRAKYEEVPMETRAEHGVEAVAQSICGVSPEGSIAGTFSGDEAEQDVAAEQ